MSSLSNNKENHPASKTMQKNRRTSSKRISKRNNYNDHEKPFEMNLTDYLFTTFLTDFLLKEDQLCQFGYPISNTKDQAIFFCDNPWLKRRPDFVQTSLLESVIDLPVPAIQDLKPVERTCSRCFASFYILDNKYVKEEKCIYHWGKYVAIKEFEARQFSCCNGSVASPGCSTASHHVWSGVTYGVNGPFNGFVRTYHQPQNCSVFSMDCEMVYTVAGMEVAKVSVVGTDGNCVYDSFIRPENEIVDFNSRFSGITKEDMEAENGRVKNLEEVQKDLTALIGRETTLIGHGLENDLRGLKIIHRRIVDTAVVFKHEKGFPYKKSLRDLMQYHLRDKFESEPKEHDSLVDARRCMLLMIYKVRLDYMVPMFWMKGMTGI